MTLYQIATEKDKIFCASLMASYEPWVTLQRSFEQAFKIINDPTSEVYLAKHDDQAIGFAIIKLKGAFVGYIQSILIIKDFQKQGFGKQLIRELETYMFSKYPNIFICVSSFNPEALKFYNSIGYEVIGELTDYIIKGHSEFLLRKSICSINEFIEKKGNIC